MTEENWVAVPGFDNFYEVSDQGRVRSWANGQWGRLKEPRFLKPGARTGSVKYLVVCLRRAPVKKTKYVHRLVAELFLGPPPPNTEVAHKNGNHLDNRADNLKWATRKENSDDKWEHGTHPRQLVGG